MQRQLVTQKRTIRSYLAYLSLDVDVPAVVMEECGMAEPTRRYLITAYSDWETLDVEAQCPDDEHAIDKARRRPWYPPWAM